MLQGSPVYEEAEDGAAALCAGALSDADAADGGDSAEEPES
jgi:hypothetical protein